ncbi:hypothetical protein LUZ63_007509 [Rhynchospora breviuscula]|uniref:RING-type E3 ubiquitin transferase n=1 Tax=Rhynchospora breviuscula TaxID=2022672 RepID=A0A9Q0HUG3_9POAL|nr:hypothetical protein LUZ63_007509 [Rhynchospora breviuscula]
MAGQNYLPRHIERTHEQSRSNPISDSHLQFGHNPMPPRSDLRLDVPPPPVPYPNQYMRSNSRQTSIAPINHPTIMPRSNRDHASSSSSFNLHPEYPSYYPTVHHTSNESSSSYFSLNYSEAGPSYPPPHVPRDVTDNRRTVLKRKHHDVPVDPIHTEYWPSESGTSGVAHNWVTDLAEGSQRNVRIRQGYYSPLELNPPRHYVPSTVTPQHYSVQSNPHGLRGPEHANYSVHVAAQDRNIPDPGRFNNDPSSVHHGGNHIANHRTIVRCEPNYYAQNRSSTLPVTSHQGNIARAVGHVNTSFPHIADHHGPTPAYATASASARWRQGFSEFEASSSLSRPISFSDSSMGSTGPRNSDPGLRTSFHVDHNAGRWLFEHFVSPEDPLLFNSRELFDEHRDMRLDIDDMSYEELLDLEERIGYVSTGLPGDRILKCLKETTYRTCNESQGDSCVICMEEYEKGDKVGTLNCAHNFHTTCIKKWLERKNICPVCKSEAFEVSSQK